MAPRALQVILCQEGQTSSENSVTLFSFLPHTQRKKNDLGSLCLKDSPIYYLKNVHNKPYSGH